MVKEKIVRTYWGVETRATGWYAYSLWVGGKRLKRMDVGFTPSFCFSDAPYLCYKLEDAAQNCRDGETPIKLKVTIEEA